MTSGQHRILELKRWGEALALDRQHGAGTSDFLASRVTDLAMMGDIEAANRWVTVASLCDQLRNGTIQ